MDAAYPPLSVPASPDYFFGLFGGEAAFYGFTFDSPADELAEAWDEFAWNRVAPLRRGLVASFPDHITVADFDREFPTLKGRTVGDLCRFLAERVPRPAVRPWLNDRTAGAFLTLRHQLVCAGADVTPSAPLEPYLRSHQRSFEWDLQKLAPGLPFPTVLYHFTTTMGLLILVGVVSFLAGLALMEWFGLAVGHWLALTAGVCWAVSMLLFITTLVLPPRRVTLGDLVTFRDLARAVAVQQPA